MRACTVLAIAAPLAAPLAISLATSVAANLLEMSAAFATPPPIHPARPAAKPAVPAAAPHTVAPAPTAQVTVTPAQPGPPLLHAAIPPGEGRDALRRLLLKPYAEATGTDLPDPSWDGASLDTILKPPAGPVPDLVLLTGAQLAAACKSQAIARLDWTALGRDRYLAQAVSDCGAGAYVSAVALAWDRDKLPATPNWSDFWDVARHPGGRGLPRTARFDLEIALLADGVAANDVYRTLRTTEGQDRAFRKLDQLKPYLLWWDKPAQPAQMLAAGRVLLTATPTGPMLQDSDATHRAYGLQWQGSLMEIHSLAMPQNAPNPTVANAALLITADIARQADFGHATGLGPTAKAAIDLLPPGARAASPTNPANLQDALFIDEGFWLDNQDKLQARFEAWAAK